MPRIVAILLLGLYHEDMRDILSFTFRVIPYGSTARGYDAQHICPRSKNKPLRAECLLEKGVIRRCATLCHDGQISTNSQPAHLRSSGRAGKDAARIPAMAANACARNFSSCLGLSVTSTISPVLR